MQTAGTVVGQGQTAAWGVFGAMLLREDAGGYVLVAVVSFAAAVVITALCFRLRSRENQRKDGADKPTRHEQEEEKPMKKRILSILLCLCMAACMLPTVAFAADTGKAIQLGTNALNKNVNTEAAPTVYFGQDHGNNPAAWRVIGYDGSGVAGAQGDMTLLAAGTMGEAAFDSVNYSSEYAPSELKTAIDALEAKLTTEENAAVKKRTLASGSYNGENTDCVAGAQVDNAVFWPLSIAEAHAVNQDLRIVNKEHTNWAMYHWWLRSPCKLSSSAAVVHGNGEVLDDGMYHTSDEFGVRPAFNLNLNAVLFTSAAVDGKPDGGLTPISEHTGNEWKLTLLDNSRNFAVTETTASGNPGDPLTLHYSGATTGTNEYISVILADNSGAKYYGRVAQPTEATGTVEIEIPSDLAPGSYTLKVFSEQYNGDRKTDYASNFTNIALTAGKQVDEQFALTCGSTYYFDLSGAGIPGTANSNLPDNTLRYVPFTYAGTVDAYKLTSAMATTEEYAQQNKYPHSLFIADYNVTHKINWDDLNTANLIFGKDYAASGVDYTLRAPSVGSRYTGSGESQRGTPQSNEWDRVLDKDDGYIKNRNKVYSWGQDTTNFGRGFRAVRGYYSARHWYYYSSSYQNVDLGFRPVLEVPNPGSPGSDGLKAVTLDLGGGKLGGSTDTIQIIVKNGSKFTAPASDGLTRPDGNTGRYFMWLGSDRNLYAPGESVPEVVTTLTAQWTVNQYTITYDLAGGTVEGNPNTYTIETVAFTLKNPTKSGYTFTGWSGTGLDGENNMTVTIPTGSTGNRTYKAHWRYNGSGHSYSYYTIKATAGAGGSISPSGNVSVREGRDRTFTITPDKGYAISNVKIDGKSIGAVKSYTFENVRRTHTIEVIFTKANGNPQTGVFVDVATGSYYEDAVDWAVENGITKGTDDTHFSPDGICTRAQAVTFLWRAAGSPKPEPRAMPFTDVPVGSYYYDAVLWAVENGITKGTSDTTFSPNMTCTRAQIVAFLWRSEKSPAAGIANPFADVKSTAYYADAVLWAVKENITKGTTSTTFSPNADCTRAQIVTFLWRCKK